MDNMLDEEAANRELQEVSKFADKNQRLAFRRKEKRIEELIERLRPFEEEKLKIILEMQPIMDEIKKVRETMVDDCVHPIKHLVHKGSYVECKFCNTKIRLNRD